MAMRDSSGEFSSALIIRPGALGDTLVVLPALAELRKRIHVVFAGRRPGLRFVAHRVHRALDFEASGWHHLFSEGAVDMAMPDLNPRIVAGFMNDRDGVIHRNLSGWFPFASIRLFPSMPGEGRNGHVARYIAECLKQAGLPLDADRVMRRCREAPLLGTGRPASARTKLVIHPGSGSTAKNHPIEFWSRLMKQMLRGDDFRSLEVCVLLGPAEKGLSPALEGEFRGTGVQVLVQPDLDRLAAVLETAALCVGHDSGISHLAAMFGVPTLALFKTSRPDRWHPLGPCVRVVLSMEADAGLEKKVLDAGRELLTGFRCQVSDVSPNVGRSDAPGTS